jgi:predicted nucleotidyltransferase
MKMDHGQPGCRAIRRPGIRQTEPSCNRHAWKPRPRYTPSVPIAAPILAKLPEVAAACERAGVRRLWIFGSAAHGEWRAEPSGANPPSDIDFLVEDFLVEDFLVEDFLVELDPSRPFPAQFLGLYRELKAIFGREIDLISVGGVKNPHFRAELEETRVPVYAAA